MAKLNHCLALLEALERQLRGGHVVSRANFVAWTYRGGAELAAEVHAGLRRGVPLLGPLAALRESLRASDAFQRETSRLLAVARYRFGLALVGAVAARCWLTGSAGFFPRAVWDAVACALALLICVAGLHLLRRAMPCSWLWQGGVSAEGLAYFQALLGGPGQGLGVQGELAELRRRELLSGVSQAQGRKHLLDAYARRQLDVAQLRLARLEDLWPLAELVLTGLPVLLILLLPLIALLER